MEDKFNELDMMKFVKWVNIRCERTCWQNEYLFKGVRYDEKGIFDVYMKDYFSKQESKPKN